MITKSGNHLPLKDHGESAFSQGELIQYSRHLCLEDFGIQGQRKLKDSAVLVVGAGGLGAPALLYLAAAGVGNLGIVDFDTVDATNLQRQILYNHEDLDQPKVEQAKSKLQKMNPYIEIQVFNEKLNAENVISIFDRYDLVIDGADNFSTRYLINDACGILKKPLVSASVLGFEGQLSVFHYQGGPCYRCLYPAPPPLGSTLSCSENGVLGILPGVLGLLQATEAIKVLTGIGEVTSGKLLHFDALSLGFTKLNLKKEEECRSCGGLMKPSDLVSIDDFCGVGGKSQTVASLTPRSNQMNSVELQARRLRHKNLILLDVREHYETEICQLPNSVWIPLQKLIDEGPQNLDPDSQIVVYCKSGRRSQIAIDYLKSKNFKNLWNLEGGILGWIRDVDSHLKAY